MSTADELKPCPFCGGNDIYANVGIYIGKEWLSVTIKCDDCGASIWGYTLEEAIAVWNRRAQASECRNVRPDCNSFKCSECGGSWYGVGDIARPYPKHCPNCGRRIKEDE